MSPDLSLVDTNVLVYSHFTDADQHAASKALLDQAQSGAVALCIAQQNLAEFYSTVTNPKRVTSPFSPAEAIDAIDQILAMPGMTLLPTPTDVSNQWLDLLRAHPVIGRKTFDAQLIGIMLVNGVKRVYTFNTSDFDEFGVVEVLEP